MKQTPRSLLVLSLLIFASYFILFPDLKADEYFTSEDGIIENIGALAFGMAMLSFAWLFVKSGNKNQNPPENKNFWYLGLSLLFLLACGEEISWGQRIFGWDTPEGMKEMNIQQETNLHNLEFMVNKYADQEEKSFLQSLLVITAGRLFLYFWVLYMVMVPIAHRLSARFHTLFRQLKLPIPPIWAGGLMILNYALFLVFVSFTATYPIDTYGSLSEIKETNYAIVIAIWGAYWIYEVRSKAQLQVNWEISE